jgi:hypothetical protein
MTTTNFRHASVLLLGVVCACQLPPDLLEAGNADDSDTSGEGDTSGDGDTTGDGETSDTGDTSSDTGDTGDPDDLECVLQGTNLDGGTDPEDYLLPNPSTCEVICAQGWGHDVPLLESEWTSDVPMNYVWQETPTRGALAIAADERVVMVFSATDQFQMGWLNAENGNYVQGHFEGPIGELLDFGIDADEDISYSLWMDGETQRLRATQGNFDEIFSLELSSQVTDRSRFAVLDDGVIVSLDDGGGNTSRLMRIDQAGTILFNQPVPLTLQIDVSPSGNVIALANFHAITWFDAQGDWLGEQGMSNVAGMLGLVAINDTNAVFSGSEFEPGFDGGVVHHRGAVRKYGAMGPGWAHTYDRADTWCVEFDAHATEELLTGIVQLADATLVVTGIESLGHPYGNDIDTTSQPWVAHVSAAGDVLEFDRGFWQGRPVDVVARDNVAYVLLTTDGDSNSIGWPRVRKYSF